MASIFTKIIRGEIPAHRVYEDEHAFAFLDINPRRPGHTLVVPKREVDELFDLPPDDYEALWRAARVVGGALKRAVGCDRVFVMVVGIDVPHAHVHLIPATGPLTGLPMPPVVEQSEEQLSSMADRIAAEAGPISYDAQTALLVVDVQNDFADPDGSLAVGGAPEIVPVVNEEIARAGAAGATIAYTQDWHPPSTPHFQKDGGTWPVHCVADTWGADFHPDLTVVEGASFTRKGTGGEDGYSGFSMRDPEGGEPQPTGLAAALEERGIERVVIAGLATDYCVKETALDAVRLGFETVALSDAMRAVELEPGDGGRALEEMRRAGVEIR
jgi:nicotinamidase/pyrazinamidase